MWKHFFSFFSQGPPFLLPTFLCCLHSNCWGFSPGIFSRILTLTMLPPCLKQNHSLQCFGAYVLTVSTGYPCSDDLMTQWPQCWVYYFYMTKCIPSCSPSHQPTNLRSPYSFLFNQALNQGHFTFQKKNHLNLPPNFSSTRIDLAQALPFFD